MNEIEKAIEALEEYGERGLSLDTIKIIHEALEAQQADMWIPIKDFEDIPKNNGFYIFQTKGKKIHEWWFEDGKIYVDNIHDEEYLFKAEDMAAWMPLPEPWKEEQS
jgi:hypothetical protein